jgi:hypothetical protein
VFSAADVLRVAAALDLLGTSSDKVWELIDRWTSPAPPRPRMTMRRITASALKTGPRAAAVCEHVTPRLTVRCRKWGNK